MKTIERKWLCEHPTSGLVPYCAVVAKVALLHRRRQLCSYHAWLEAKVPVSQTFWEPGELLELIGAAEQAR